jgi:hypothetical protein
MHLQQTDVLGLDLADGFFGEPAGFMNLDAAESSSSNNSQLPPYFFPEQSVPTTSGPEAQGISPMMTIGEMNQPAMKVEAAPAVRPQSQRMNYYPGYHQEMYNQNMQMQAQKLARQKAAAAAAPKAPSHPRQTEIDAILNSFKISPSPAAPKSTSEILPHIARMKKEEEDMDEDERLLASEEGKKLSSKERRQLRNKVSARAFRSRRKEYITQLEAEVAKKTQEAEAVKEANRRLEEENSRLRGFSEMLMKHPAFQEFLKDLSAPLLQPTPAPQPVTVAPAAVEPMPTFNPARDTNPHVSAEDQWPLAYSTAWNNNTSHVYSVEVPEGPAIQDLDGKSVPFEDYSIADGFFSHIRNEKADIDFSRMDEEEDSYQAPENLEDVYFEEAQEKTKNLDELFPGVGVNDLLERLEMVAGGEARPEDLFEIETTSAEEAVVAAPPAAVEMGRGCVSVTESNRMLQQAEGVYRRIGLAVGAGQ